MREAVPAFDLIGLHPLGQHDIVVVELVANHLGQPCEDLFVGHTAPFAETSARAGSYGGPCCGATRALARTGGLSDGMAMTSAASGPAEWRFDHVGVVVKSLDAARARFAATLGIAEWTASLEDPVNGVRLQFGRDPGGMVYELLEPIDEASPVHRALKSRSNLLNHSAYRVPSLAEAAEHLRESGCMPAGDPRPAIAFGGAPIQFFVSPDGILIELIEAPDHRHPFVGAAA